MQLRLLQSYLITLGAQLEEKDKQRIRQFSNKNEIQMMTITINQVVKSNDSRWNT